MSRPQGKQCDSELCSLNPSVCLWWSCGGGGGLGWSWRGTVYAEGLAALTCYTLNIEAVWVSVMGTRHTVEIWAWPVRSRFNY